MMNVPVVLVINLFEHVSVVCNANILNLKTIYAYFPSSLKLVVCHL